MSTYIIINIEGVNMSELIIKLISNLITIFAILYGLYDMEKCHKNNDLIGVIQSGVILICISILHS